VTEPGGRLPTALLVTSSQSSTIADGLLKVKERCQAAALGVDVCVRSVPTEKIASLLRSEYDLVILDGHGYFPEETGSPPRIGRLPIDPASIRDDEDRGITAAAVVLGGCWAGTPEFTEALRSCIDSPVAFLGSDRETEYEHAEVIFDRVIEVLARLGPGPEPAKFGEQLAAMCAGLRDEAPGWHVEMLSPLSHR
jgi:hypothetical protein